MIIKTQKEFEAVIFPKIIAVDTETTSLNPRIAKLDGIGWGDSKNQYYVDWQTCSFKNEVIKKFDEVFKTSEIVFHNAKFDMKILTHIWKIDYPVKIQDTMIMSWMLNENRQHGLKDLTTSLLRKKVTKFDELGKPKEGTFWYEADMLKYREDLGIYCCADVRNTFDLYELFTPLMAEQELEFAYNKVELPMIKVLANMESKGITLDVDSLKKLESKADAFLLEKESEIYTMLGREFNIRSSKQLRDIIFEYLKVTPEKLTPSGMPSTDNESLSLLAKKDIRVKAILDYREFDKLNGTYLKGLQEKAENGVLYADFLQHRTRSGRLASAGPNLQNIPRRSDDFDVRKNFIARPGHKFIIADYSQIELRVIAEFSQEANMVKVFREGGDIHQLTADMVGCSRQHAKAINFGLLYGLGPDGLAKDLVVTKEVAQGYINTFFQKYSQLTSYIAQVQNAGLYKGYVDTLTKRRRRFKFSKSTSKGEMEGIKRKIINTKVQGSAADLMKIAMVRLERMLKPFNARMLIQIHDEILVEAPEDKAEEVKKIVEEAMEGAVSFSIPTPAEAKISDCWVK